MENLIQSIEKCLKSENWYGALVLSLILPDICSSCSSNDGKTDSKRYAEWFDKYIDVKYSGHVSGSDAYAFRCSYLHQGIFDVAHQKIQRKTREKNSSVRVLDKFSWNSRGSHLCSFSDCYSGHCDDGKEICHLSVEEFSKDIITSARKWLSVVAGNKQIESHINSLPDICDSASIGGFVVIK